VAVSYELRDIPKEPKGLFTDEGRRRVAQVIVWGAIDQLYDRVTIQRRLEALLERIAKGLEQGKYGR